MSWKYSQSQGRLWKPDGSVAGIGYAGANEGKNNPSKQDIKNVGPLPRGSYSVVAIGTTNKGAYSFKLIPDQTACMFGRSGFMIHGDSIKNPGTASEGCIVIGSQIRKLILDSQDRKLEVIE